MPQTTKDPLKVTYLGSRIRELRKERNLTQAELARQLGIQQSDLCRMESGEYRVNLAILSKILHLFQLSPSEFFQEKPANRGDGWKQGLIEDFEKLTPESRDEILEFVRFKQTQERNSRG